MRDQVRDHMRKFAQSMEAARSGIVLCLRSERNFRFHLIAVFYVLIFALLGRIERYELLAVILCFALVISAEMFNTAIELICDKGEQNGYSVVIKAIKDISAGAVLVNALIAAVVGLLVFTRKEVADTIIQTARANPAGSIGLLLSIVPATIFIRKRKNK